MRISLPLVGEENTYKDIKVLDAQECINMYYTYDANGKFPTAVLAFPGLSLFSEGLAGEKNVRTLFSLNERLFTIIDNKFIELNGSGERKETIGIINSIDGPVKIESNDYQLMITDGFAVFIYQLTDNEGRKKGDYFQAISAFGTIGAPVFSGPGSSNDLTVSGPYTGQTSTQYQVIITEEAVPNDKFKWSSDGGTTFVDNIEIDLLSIFSP